VKSVNRLLGTGGRRIWPGLGRVFVPVAESAWEALDNAAMLFESGLEMRGVLDPTPALAFWDVCARQGERASQNMANAISNSRARNRYFLLMILSLWFVLQFAKAWCRDFGPLAFDLERKREILARMGREREQTSFNPRANARDYLNSNNCWSSRIGRVVG
jgi:hypothetical protein